MPAPNQLLKWTESDDHRRLIEDFKRKEDYLFNLQANPLQQAIKNEQLYLGDIKDERGPAEKWRANYHDPIASVLTETKVAVITDILAGGDPVIQVLGKETSSHKLERPLEDSLDYCFGINHWRRLASRLARRTSIHGTAVVKLVYRNSVREINPRDYTSHEEWLEWLELVMRAANLTGPQVPPELDTGENVEPPGFSYTEGMYDRTLFEEWRKSINLAKPNLAIPPYPLSDSTVYVFRGPAMTLPSIFDVRFDPYETDIEEMGWFAQRIVRSRKWLEDRLGDDPFDTEKPFSYSAVEKILAQGSCQDRFNEWQQQYFRMLGLEERPNDPDLKDSVELFELWRPEEEFSHALILNRSGVINWWPDLFPFVHKELPYTLVRNTHTETAYGTTELQTCARLFHEIDYLSNIRTDGITLSTMPILLRQTGFGVADLQRMITPGAVIDVPNLNGIANLTEKLRIPSDSAADIASKKAICEDAFACYSNVRGQPTQINRVSATETERVFSQALSRHKQIAAEFEDDLIPRLPKQMLALLFQYGDAEMIKRIAGETLDVPRLTKGDILEALGYSFSFRGATSALGRGQQVNELISVLKVGGADMLPDEKRAIIGRILDRMGLRGATEILSPDNTQRLQGAATSAIDATQNQQEQAQQQAPAGPGGAGAGAAPAGGEEPQQIPMEDLQKMMANQNVPQE